MHYIGVKNFSNGCFEYLSLKLSQKNCTFYLRNRLRHRMSLINRLL